MDEKTRRECTPQEYIRKLFSETQDGKLRINYFSFFDGNYSLDYRMNWTKQDAEAVVEDYNELTAALTRIGELHEELEDEENRTKLLTTKELAAWLTYILPFEPFEVDMDVIGELYSRMEGDSLEEEEYELLERYHQWFVENSHKRLPSDQWCPAQLINRARRYEKLIEMKSPEVVINEEGRCLAEEMVLYSHCKKKLVLDSLKFIMAQMGIYENALEEIKNGRKLTHWMWFVFPQLKGLGTSDMANTYGIEDLDEAQLYLAHEVLGARLVEISAELLKLDEDDSVTIFGDVDAMKLRSSMTLFALVSEENSVFHKVLEKYFNSQPDSRTLELLEKNNLY